MSERQTHFDEEYGCWTYKCASGTAAKLLKEFEDILYDESGKEVISLDRLREIAEAERSKRLYELPIRPGEPFSYIENGEVFDAVVASYEIGHLAIFFRGCGVQRPRPFAAVVFETGVTDIGKIAFKTHEEAVAALAEKGAE